MCSSNLVLNPAAARALAARGCSSVHAHAEGDDGQLADLCAACDVPLVLPVFGRPALMLTRAWSKAPPWEMTDGRETVRIAPRQGVSVARLSIGKLRAIIVSGDNRSEYYNEPNKMRSALIERGVPALKIVRDFAGRRTLDSVYRAKEVFGADRVVFISQRFQNERAIYLAKAQGMKAWAWNAKEVRGSGAWKTRIREVGARIKMWLDVQLLNTQPKHYGPRESLPE